MHMNKAKVLGLSPVAPSDVVTLSEVPFEFLDDSGKKIRIRKLIHQKLVYKDYVQATVNGNFMYLNLGDFCISAKIMKDLVQEYIKAGWGAMSFNLWKGKLAVNLWKNPYSGESSCYIDGQEV